MLRFEDFDDVGNVTKSRIAMSWYLVESLQLRPPLADENLSYLASQHNPYGQYAYVNLILAFGG